MTKFFQVNFRKSHEILDQFHKSIKSYIKMFEAAGLLDPLPPPPTSSGRVNHQKVPKYYKYIFLQNFLSFFISILTALIVKNSHILSEIYLPKNIPEKTWNTFNKKIGPQKDRESFYQVRQILAHFRNLVALILG